MPKECCGRVLGHGLTCQPGYLCDNCKLIKQLYEELEELKGVLRLLQKQAQEGVDALDGKTYSDPETERLRQKAVARFKQQVEFFEAFLE